jgi:aryl sulfotransferase
MQQIIGQMLFGPTRARGGRSVAVARPAVPPKAVKLPVVEAQSRRRFLKTIYRSMRWSSRRR